MVEYLDVVDSNGTKTGEVVERDEAHLKGIRHVVADALIFNNEKKVLLQRRALDKQTNPGLWTISAGGHVSSGEIVEIGMLNEIEEEVGLKVEVDDLNYVKSFAFDEVKGNLNISHFKYLYFVKKDFSEKDVKIQIEEVSEFKLILIDDLEKFCEDNLCMITEALKDVVFNHWNDIEKFLK